MLSRDLPFAVRIVFAYASPILFLLVSRVSRRNSAYKLTSVWFSRRIEFLIVGSVLVFNTVAIVSTKIKSICVTFQLGVHFHTVQLVPETR